MKIADFVVGLGFDSSEFEKGMKQASSQLGGFRSDVLQLSATLAGAFGTKELTLGFAERNNELRQMAELLGVTTDELYGLEAAGQAFGASAGEMTASLSKLAEARANFERLGKIGIFEELALIGVDFDKINAASSEIEAMYILADQISKLDPRGQMMAANILGLSPQTLDILAKGGDEVRDLSDAFRRARPHAEEMAEASKDLIYQWNLLLENVGGKADKISTPLVESLSKIGSSINEWFVANQKVIDQKIDVFIENVAKNLDVLLPAAIAIAGSGVAATFASLAKYIPIVGGSIGAVAAGLSKLVPIVGAIGTGWAIWDWDEKTFKERFGIDLPAWLFQPLGEVLGEHGTDLSDFPDRQNPAQIMSGKRERFNLGGLDTDWLFQPIDGSAQSTPLGIMGGRYGASSLIGRSNQSTPIYTTANITLNIDGEKLAEKQVYLTNGQIDATIKDVQTTELR